MNMDFDSIVRALKEIGCSGYFTLEAAIYLNAFDSSNILDGMKNLATSAKKIAEMFETI